MRPWEVSRHDHSYGKDACPHLDCRKEYDKGAAVRIANNIKKGNYSWSSHPDAKKLAEIVIELFGDTL